MTSKIKPYKFVNPGGVVAKDAPAGKMVRGITLSFNRIGTSVEGIGNIVKDINDNNKLAEAVRKRQVELERKRKRLEQDRLAEQRLEQQSESQAKRKSKEEDSRSPELKKVKKGFLGFLDGFLNPVVGFFGNIIGIGIATSALDWASDENNRKQFSEFIRKLTFVVQKVWGFINSAVSNIGEGFSKMIDPESGFIDRLGGLGQMLFGIIGLKYLMNPMSIITDILSVLDLFGNQADKVVDTVDKVKEDKKKRRRAEGTGGDIDAALDEDGKPKRRSGPVDNPRQSGVNKFSQAHGNEAARAWTNAYDNAIDEGLTPSQASQKANRATNRLLTKGKLTSQPKLGTLKPTAATGVKGSTLMKGVAGDTFGKFKLDKLSKRFILKFLGKGGYKGVMAVIKKIRIPFFSTFITAVFNWIAGDSVLEAASKGLGAGLGEILGGWAGGALGAFGGPAAPITVPLGAFLGSMLGSIVGEAIGGWIYRTMTGKTKDGEGLGALGKAAVAGAKKLWTDFIANGEFWAGLWDSIKNLGGQIMDGAWNAMMSIWNFASSTVMSFADMLMEATKPWRESVWKAFQKYILTPFFDIPSLIVELAKTLADQAVKSWMESKQFMNELGKIFQESLDKILKWDVVGKIALVLGNPLANPVEKLEAIWNLVKDAFGPSLKFVMGKVSEVADAFKTPITDYIDPAVTAIKETWKLATGLPGVVYNSTIKPVFDLISGVWNSGGKIWEWLNKENTFQDLTGQEPIDPTFQQGLSAGGKVALYAGHADMKTDGSAGKAYGTSGGDVSADGRFSTASTQSYASGYQSNEAYFNDKIAQKAAQMSGGIAEYRAPVRVGPSSDSRSNYSRIDRDNAKGITTFELHMDSPRGMPGLMAVNPSVSTRAGANGFIKAVQGAYGTHTAQRGLGAVNNNNLSALVEIAPLKWEYLRNPQAFINREATRLANAIKAGANGKVPERDASLDGSLGDDTPMTTNANGEMVPAATVESPASFFESIVQSFKDFANILAGGEPGEDTLGIGDLGISFDEQGNMTETGISPAEESSPLKNLTAASAFTMPEDVKLKSIGNYDFSKEYAMDFNLNQNTSIPFIIEMPVPISVPVIINKENTNLFVPESPLLEK